MPERAMVDTQAVDPAFCSRAAPRSTAQHRSLTRRRATVRDSHSDAEGPVVRWTALCARYPVEPL
jgi:hypothetical protein